jgi:hypothetical protein
MMESGSPTLNIGGSLSQRLPSSPQKSGNGHSRSGGKTSATPLAGLEILIYCIIT